MGNGHGAWDKETRRQGRIYPILNAQCPMPNAQCPMPNAQCPNNLYFVNKNANQ
ncbi:hypothetical protein [Tolypothrix sp. VBCCA 56010]|uniref:hypothetical protein n=1 Tax=Tolypothrix sp. VBCCA 56010 TaxID=3137731 RepID=UPI003D7CA9C5